VPAGERLREDHAEALPAEGRRHEQVGLAQARGLLRVADLPERADAARVVEERLDLVGPRRRRSSAPRRRARAAPRRRAGGPGRPLALDGLADERQAQDVVARRRAAAQGEDLRSPAGTSTPFGTTL
jgi:hypothetical protein